MFRHIQGYWCIFIHTYRCATRKREEASLSLFKNRKKKCPDFWKKSPDFAHLSVKLSTQNVALRASRRKNSKMFLRGASFSCVFDKIFIEMLESYSKPCDTLTRHIQNCHSQNSLFRHYSAIFRTLCNSRICWNLLYSEVLDIQNPPINPV